MEELGIAGIFLFGSQAQGVANPKSDFDFGVLLKNSSELRQPDKREKIYTALYDLFSSQIKKLCDIDIVFLQSADLQLRSHVARDGSILYAGEKKLIGDFLERTMEETADFAPLRREFHEAILARV